MSDHKEVFAGLAGIALLVLALGIAMALAKHGFCLHHCGAPT